MLTVHLRINDAATGKPTPVRLRITGPDGTYYAPLGRSTEFARGRNEDVGGNLCVGRERFAYIDGSCEVRLPAGVPLRVQATKGPEYEPLDQTVILGPGKMALRFALKRWSDLRADGWHPGDTRAHFLSPHTAALEAAAEDVAVVNLLACAQPFPSLDGTLYPGFPNLTAFSGQQPALQTDSALVAVNTLNVHPVLGSVGLLHSHRVVYPLAFGDDDTDDWSVCDWCDQCHRKNGLTVWADPFNPSGGEALAALVLGKIDAVEFDGRPRKLPLVPLWYRLLNAGFRIPIVGGSGKDSNAIPLGTPRTYAKLNPGEPLTYSAWIEAVRAGRCFATNGPLLHFDADGKGPGETLDLSGPEVPVRVRATADGLGRFDRLELLAGEQVIASSDARPDGSRWSAAVEATYNVTEPGWVSARCIGGANPTQPVFAHTAPTYLRLAGQYRRETTSRTALRRMVDQTREWVELHGRFTEEKHKRHLLDLCDAALARLE
ncbi:MAG TPA: CehA/McbA family metallohydrolase [Fimbriiglobus sp.]|nr:CehA/McbA family metallohydrolase [Fimbriiglobus sp.]